VSSEPEVTAISTTGFIFPTATAQSTMTVTSASVTAVTSPGNNSTIMSIVIGIIALALLGGGVITWMGSPKKEERD
jgi:hypothetical protein